MINFQIKALPDCGRARHSVRAVFRMRVGQRTARPACFFLKLRHCLISVDFGAGSCLMDGAMNTSLVKSVPQGDFVEVSALMKDWETKFQMLVSQKRPIKYDMYPMPNISQEFQNRLAQQGYCDLILESDQWQHFLVPNSN
jgi:hypothetical protein